MSTASGGLSRRQEDWQEGYERGRDEGFDEGRADERKLHGVRRWVSELPDVDGWYWFDGEYEESVCAQAWDAELPENIWHKFQSIVRIDRDYIYLDGEAVEFFECSGTWIGPLLNPFEEADDE